MKQLSEFEWEFEGKVPTFVEVQSKIDNNNWNRLFGDPSPSNANIINNKREARTDQNEAKNEETSENIDISIYRPKRNCTIKTAPSLELDSTTTPETASESVTPKEEPVKRKRGRPRKIFDFDAEAVANKAISMAQKKLNRPQFSSRSFHSITPLTQPPVITRPIIQHSALSHSSITPPTMSRPTLPSLPSNVTFLSHPDRLDPKRLARRIYLSLSSNLKNETEWAFKTLLDVTFEYDSPFTLEEVKTLAPELLKHLNATPLDTDSATIIIILTNIATDPTIAQYLASCNTLMNFLNTVILNGNESFSWNCPLLYQEVLLNSLDLMDYLAINYTITNISLIEKLVEFCFSNDQALVCKGAAVLIALFYNVKNEPLIDHLPINLYHHLVSLLLIPYTFKMYADAESDDKVHTMITLSLHLICLMIKYYSPLEAHYKAEGAMPLLSLLTKYLDSLIFARPLPNAMSTDSTHQITQWLDLKYRPHPTSGISLKQICTEFKQDNPYISLNSHAFTKCVLRHFSHCQFSQIGVNSEMNFYLIGLQRKKFKAPQYKGRENGYQIGLEILHWLSKISELKAELFSYKDIILKWQLKGVGLSLDLANLQQI
jgi:hypothetical protein